MVMSVQGVDGVRAGARRLGLTTLLVTVVNHHENVVIEGWESPRAAGAGRP
jgi:hypothetical protein